MQHMGHWDRIVAACGALAVGLALVLGGAAAEGAEVKGPSVRLEQGAVYAGAAVTLDEGHVQELKKGIAKSVTIYVDLFRNWDIWPDEFVAGQVLTRSLSCDPVKSEYIATSLLGSRLTEKRFPDCAALMRWALTIDGLKVAPTEGLEPGEYFVKVIATGRHRRMPPFIGLLFFFAADTEFRAEGRSAPLRINQE